MGDSKFYTSGRRVFIALATSLAFIAFGVQLLSGDPGWAVALMLAGALYLLFEANFNPWSRQNIPGMIRFVGTVMIVSTLIGIYLRPILEHFKVAPKTATEKYADQSKQDQDKPQEQKGGARRGHDDPIVRIGKCPDQYKSVSNVKIAQWTMDEADKISDMSANYLEKYRNSSRTLRLGIFNTDFKQCCFQDVLDLRDETICRLPPTMKTVEGETEFHSLLSGTALSPTMTAIDPLSVQAFAPYLRKLGVQLMRLHVPRRAPMAAIVSATAQQPGVIEVTVKPNTGTISTGYIVVDVDGLDGPYVSGVRAFGDIFRTFGDSFRERTSMATIANEDVVKYLQNHPSAFAFRISRGHPLSRVSPIQMTVSGGPKLQVRSATIFDE